MEEVTFEEIRFFSKKQNAFDLYKILRAKIRLACPQAVIQVKKTQISFFDRHMFCAVSFLPARPAKDRPKQYITVTFGLPYRLDSPKVDIATEAYPNRWTHHVLVGDASEIDHQLLSWIVEAAEFSRNKR